METVLPIFFFSRVGKPVRWFATVEVAAAVAHIKLVRSISELLPHCSLCYLVLCVCVCAYIHLLSVCRHACYFQKEV